MSDTTSAPTDDLATRLAAKMAARKPAPAPAVPTSTPVISGGQLCNGRGWYKNEGAGFAAVEKGHTCPACAHREGLPDVTPQDAPCPETSREEAAAQDAPPPAAEPAPTHAKRGRKPKAASAPVPEATPTPTPETAATEPAVAPQAAPELVIQKVEVHTEDPERFARAVTSAFTGANPAAPDAYTSTAPGARLYINCRPLVGPDAGSDPFAFNRWMANVLAAIVAELKVPHYRLLKYGAGAGALATAMAAKFSELPPVVIVDKGHPEAQEFLDIAIPRALLVNG